jgi:hypothetical protein
MKLSKQLLENEFTPPSGQQTYWPRGTIKKVNNVEVILTGDTTFGKKTGKLFYAVQIISYPFKPMGKVKAQYGKPQWVREELLT